MIEKNKNNFNQKVYHKLKLIPKGKVTTYAILAKAINNSLAFRAVGSALAKNEHLVTIPCHRVIKSDGTIGNYQKGIVVKKNLLEKEGLKIDQQGRIVDFTKYLFYFNK